ncbi:hypothetical protein [Vibrio sagamiensis]|uniref:DUF676 domain-containing protein n=1 Tax=Vibrio sagamiensis NBRC 104589 TaxID=1219064 RepID=A0A511QI67_9VIBR|nr:hypothetical protein [Vibrio sagamiensis]GEM76142.1 hypothetical protein VSA01S_22540 [Vibrio sagamiensis NBRC 104589]
MRILIYTLCNLIFIPCSFALPLKDIKIIAIHGLQHKHVTVKPSPEQLALDTAQYWQSYWAEQADDFINWSSSERLQSGVITQYVWPELQRLSQQGTCEVGCIFVTHSTGDLVARLILEHQELWLSTVGLKPLNILATFDFSGAGGGTELADIVISSAYGDGNPFYDYIIETWLGNKPSPDNIGIINDISPSTARNYIRYPYNRIPRLRIIGGGSDYANLTSGLLPGNDDGVVALHSACGSVSISNYDSCSPDVDIDGEYSVDHSYVGEFLPNHYPLIMADGYSHEDLVEANIPATDEYTAMSVSIPDDEKTLMISTEDVSWMGNTYRYVIDYESQTPSQLIGNIFR